MPKKSLASSAAGSTRRERATPKIVHFSKKRGRPRGSAKGPVERWLRQTGNPHHVAAGISMDIINYSRPRDKEHERAVLERAIAAADWTAIDAIMMRDTLDALMSRERRHITHKQAIPMAIGLMDQRSGGGVSKTEIERDEHGMLVVKPPKPDAVVKRPDPDKVARILNDRRNW
jgi:hypothetical protein